MNRVDHLKSWCNQQNTNQPGVIKEKEQKKIVIITKPHCIIK